MTLVSIRYRTGSYDQDHECPRRPMLGDMRGGDHWSCRAECVMWSDTVAPTSVSYISLRSEVWTSVTSCREIF